MGSPPVVMGLVLGQDRPQMPFAEDEHPVGHLCPDSEHEPFRVSVRPRAARRPAPPSPTRRAHGGRWSRAPDRAVHVQHRLVASGRKQPQPTIKRRDQELVVDRDCRRPEGIFAGIDVEPVSGFEPLTCRLQGGFAGPRGSTTGHLNRPDDLRGHLSVQDRLHAYTTVVSAALAAGPSIRRWTFRSRSGESPTSPTRFPSLWVRVRRDITASVTSMASFVWCAAPGASGAREGRSYPSRQPNLNG